MMFLILIETTSKMLLLLALQIQLIVKNIDNRGLNNDPLLTNISKNHDFKLNQKPPYKKKHRYSCESTEMNQKNCIYR
jgi:hypothetical protein